MIDRERLIDLVQESTKGCARYWASLIADHLIDNGIILPPVKLGDSVWDIYYSKPREWKVCHISYDGENFDISVSHEHGPRTRKRLISSKTLHRTFFLTHEDAMRASM